MQKTLTKRIQVAAKKVPADLVIKNGHIINVFTREIIRGDVAIADGFIVGLGKYEGTEEFDAAGRYIIPGLIDGHVHIESSLLPPHEFAKVSLLHGVTTVVTDPHEIGNVAGITGIRFMLASARQAPMNIHVMLPSCVPVTPFETSGAVLNASELMDLQNEPEVLGLAEVMNFQAVKETEKSLLEKLAAIHEKQQLIDGHAAGISGEDLNIYLAAGIRTDHEAVNVQEAAERLNLGMHLMVREGTVAKDLLALLPAITTDNARRCLYVTDDKLINDLVTEGSIDHNIRLANQAGFDVLTSLQMATLNAAECFKLTTVGAIAPGYQADFFLTDDLHALPIQDVFQKGRQVVADGEIVATAFTEPNLQELTAALPAMLAAPLTSEDFQLPLKEQANVIEIIPNQLITKHKTLILAQETANFTSDTTNDHLKIAVIERHHQTGNIGLGIVKGFKLKAGALATTVAHDSHNLVVVGTNDADMLFAAQQLLAKGGGMIVVDQQQEQACLPLPIGGLMADLSYQKTKETLDDLLTAARANGAAAAFDPFLTLSFLTLSVIPELKITDKGLFSFSAFQNIAVETQA